MLVIKTIRQKLGQWFSQPPGCYVQEEEQQELNRELGNLFGYHLVQLGNILPADPLEASRISHKITVRLEEDGTTENFYHMRCAADSLPFKPDSIDVVVMVHLLEFVANPHKLLREIERTLIGDGHLILIGFNPWSFFGLCRLCLAWREEPPWCGHFYGTVRIKDWLSLLDFEIVALKRFFFRPPLKKISIMDKLGFIEKLGKFCWPIFGSVYLIVAKKRVVPLTPTRLRWRSKRSMITSGIAEPSARINNQS